MGTKLPPNPFDEVMLGIGLLAGGANVIMQLSRPGVGYGVVESTVESGNVFRHPIKRNRTTITYLAVAALGTDEEKRLYRNAVNTSHRQVHSTAASPLKYNAFDPELQLWVAACLYKGFEDIYGIIVGPLDPDAVDELYAASAPLGTTLQVPTDRWPADRAAFERYWNAALEQVSIDDTVRTYLCDLASVRFLPRYLSVPLAPFNRFVTTGFLPPQFRQQMRLPWTPRQQRRFDQLMGVIGAVARRQPAVLRKFPFNLALWDLRRRIRSGRPLV